MSELVAVLGVTHNPLMWSLMAGGRTEGLDAVEDNFSLFRSRLIDLEPDALVVVASDHFHMLFSSNMPAFSIGKAHSMRGVFPNEERSFGMTPAMVTGAHDLATHILGTPNLAGGFDFAYGDEPWLDHAFMVPLDLLDPDMSLPVVPVFANTTSPPLPPARRFAELGAHLRASIESFPSETRVALLASGHLAHEIGGPRQFLGTSPSPGFDEEAVEWMRAGDLEAAIAGCSFEKLSVAGNETYQFLNFVTALAAAGVPASIAEGTSTRFGALPFFFWDLS